MNHNQKLENIEERIAKVKEEDLEISDERMKVNRKKIHVESKKYFLLFILLMVVSGGLGYFMGAGAKTLEAIIEQGNILEQAAKITAVAAPVLHIIINLIVLLIGIILLMKAKKRLLDFDDEDDTDEREVNYMLNWVMLVTQLLMVANFFLFAVTSHFGIMNNTIDKAVAQALPLIGIANVVIGLVIMTALQYKTMEYVRLLNPEKKANVFDARFQSKFEGMLDEAELMTARKAGYKAYKRTSMLLLGMWIVCIIADLAFGVGLFPMAVVIFILLIHSCTYIIEVMRLER